MAGWTSWRCATLELGVAGGGQHLPEEKLRGRRQIAGKGPAAAGPGTGGADRGERVGRADRARAGTSDRVRVRRSRGVGHRAWLRRASGAAHRVRPPAFPASHAPAKRSGAPAHLQAPPGRSPQRVGYARLFGLRCTRSIRPSLTSAPTTTVCTRPHKHGPPTSGHPSRAPGVSSTRPCHVRVRRSGVGYRGPVTG